MIKKKSYIFFSIIFILLIYFANYVNSCFHIANDSINIKLLGLENMKANPAKEITTILNKNKHDIVIKNSLDRGKYNPLYLAVRNIGSGEINPYMVVNKKDWHTNSSILQGAMGNAEDLTEEEKAVKIFEFVSSNIYHFPPPYDVFPEFKNPVKILNILGYGYCADMAYVMAIMSQQAGLPSRVVSLNEGVKYRAHVVSELFYGNAWHMFDADQGVYYLRTDNEIASVNDLINHPALITNYKMPLRYGGISNYLLSFKDAKIDSIKSGEEILTNLSPTNFEYKLDPGEEIRFYYDWPGEWFWSFSDQEPPKYTTGILISKIQNKDLVEKEKLITLPYPILSVYIYDSNLCQSGPEISFLAKGSDKWNNLQSFCQDDVIKIKDLFPRGKDALPLFSFFLKFNNKSFNNLYIVTRFQTAVKSIPQLRYGNNEIQLFNNNNFDLELKFAYYKK